MTSIERDLPLGHPSAVDTVIGSTYHKAWLNEQAAKMNARDFPPGHPKAADTPGTDKQVEWRAGVDPAHPELEEFTGRTPQAAAAAANFARHGAEVAKESPVRIPVDADRVAVALTARRAELGVDVLTEAQTQEVVAAVSFRRRSTDPKF